MIEAIQFSGAMEGRNIYGRPFASLDLRKQLSVLLKIFGGEHIERDKKVSLATKKARAIMVYSMFDDLRQIGYPIKNILNFSQKHVQAAVSLWLKDERAASTIQFRFSVMRWLTRSIGKPDMIKGYAYYGIADDQIKRTYVAQSDKSWSGHSVFTRELIEKVTEKDSWVGMCLEVMEQFGLRIRESVLIKPKHSDSGTNLNVEEGTKGGRTRNVPILTDAQREVLDRATKMAKLTKKGNLVPPGKNLSQALNRIYYVCRIFGITKDQLNITPHGLRHGYANDRYEDVSGMPSSVRGKPVNFDAEKDLLAREVVTRELGHARTSITTAYTGARVKGRPRKG